MSNIIDLIIQTVTDEFEKNPQIHEQVEKFKAAIAQQRGAKSLSKDEILDQLLDAQADLQTGLGLLRVEVKKFRPPGNDPASSTLGVAERRISTGLDQIQRLMEVMGRPMYRPETEEWCPVCKTYHTDPGEQTDDGRVTLPCPLLRVNDPRNISRD